MTRAQEQELGQFYSYFGPDAGEMCTARRYVTSGTQGGKRLVAGENSVAKQFETQLPW